MNFLSTLFTSLVQDDVVPKCICDPEFEFGHRFVPWIGETLKICAYTPRDVVGVFFGLANILIWLFAQAPQLVETYRTKPKKPALSISFLLVWLVGDIANLIGSLFTSQQLLLYTAVYFIIMDGLVLIQIFYYVKCYDHRNDNAENQNNEISTLDHDELRNVNEKTPLSPRLTNSYHGKVIIMNSTPQNFENKKNIKIPNDSSIFQTNSSGNTFEEETVHTPLISRNIDNSDHIEGPTIVTGSGTPSGNRNIISGKKTSSQSSPSGLSSQTALMISIAIIAVASINIGEASRSLSFSTLKSAISATADSLSLTANIISEQILSILLDPPVKIPICDAPTTDSRIAKWIGVVCAWICGFLYFSARIPQAIKIYKDKNVYGISLLLFAASFAANCLYALSILLPTTANFRSVAFWRDTFPYLIGSLGANVFSAIIMVQFFLYPAIKPAEDDNENNEENNDKNNDKNGNNLTSNTGSSVSHHSNEVIDLHDVKPSHDYSHCPPHHHHDAGTGQVGELVLEITPASTQNNTATNTPIQQQEEKNIFKNSKNSKNEKNEKNSKKTQNGEPLADLSTLPNDIIHTDTPGSSIQY